MKVKLMLIDEGHTVSGADYGAKGNGLEESVETRQLGKLVTKYANELGITVDKCTIDYANSVADSINKRVALANKRPHDILVIIHFNSYHDESANGCELFILPNTNGNYRSTESYNKNKEYGEKVLQAVCQAGGFVKRAGGVKFREDLGMLCSTKDYAVYLEVCFLSNKSDTDKYRANKDKIAIAIAETLAGKKLNDQNSNNNNDESEEILMQEYIVQYSNDTDKAVAEHIADRLYCPTINCAARPFKYYSHYKNVIAVGVAENKSGYTNIVIKGGNRAETMDKAIEWLKSIGK